MHAIVLGVFASFALGAVSGCIFSPRQGDPGKKPPPSYLVPSTPQAALSNLRLAYQERDSVEYRKMLWFPGYQGTSYDTSQTGAKIAGTFRWQDEVNSIQHYAQDNGVTAVSLDFGSEGSWVRTDATGPNGEPHWAEIVIHGPALEVDYTDPNLNQGVSRDANETFIYDFAYQTPAPESSTDTLWTIARWYEDAPPPP
jgi:hypothetical protein